MAPLIVLIIAFTIILVVTALIKKKWLFSFAGRTAMSVMLLFTSLGHFLYPDGMTMMLPQFIPYKTALVYLTGIIEIGAAIGLLIPRYQKLIGWLLVLFFILILPANIYAAIQQVNLKTATYDGAGINYLWFRIPLQVLFIAWVYYFVIRKPRS